MVTVGCSLVVSRSALIERCWFWLAEVGELATRLVAARDIVDADMFQGKERRPAADEYQP